MGTTENLDNRGNVKTDEICAESFNGATHNFQAEAPEPAPPPDFKTTIERLAKLEREEYLSARRTEAKILDWPVRDLDKQVKEKKQKAKAHLKVVPTQARGMFAPVEVGFWPSMELTDPHPNDIRNVKAVLDVAGIQLRHDQFTGQAVATWRGTDTIIDDRACQRLWTMLQSSELRATYHFACEAIVALSRETTFDSAVDFFSGLPKWDGTVRAETLLIDELGAEDTPYTRAATRLLFASLVRRGMGIESKCDEFAILRGPQRLGKSTIFKYLIGEDLFQENLKMGHNTREVLELTLGKLVIEMAELSGMKKVDRDDVKNFFSRTSDEFSLKHEKHRTTRKRRFIFVGTANNEGPIVNMLVEDRRFTIVPVNKRADLERIKRDRLQILAEAVEIEKNYGPILELHDKFRPAAAAARAKVVARPEYEDTLKETFGDIVSAKITVSDVYAFLGLRDRTAIGKYTKTTEGGIIPVMESLGWMRTHPWKGKMSDRARVWAFEKGDGAGWLRASWPHGFQASAEIEADWLANGDQNWRPEYLYDLEKVVPGKGVPKGRTAKNPCGSSASSDGTTMYNLNGEKTHGNSLSTLDRNSNIEDRERSIKDCCHKVVPNDETPNFSNEINGLSVVQP